MNASKGCFGAVIPRPCQQQVLDLLFGEKADEDKLYVVSPPGSGKTLLGLMVAVRMDVPALVLVPNTAIQAQWVEKSRMFGGEGGGPGSASVDPTDDKPITVLTYQSLARTARLSSEERAEILEEWLAELTSEGAGDTGVRDEAVDEALGGSDAQQWLADFEEQNPERFEAGMLRRWKRKRLASGAVGAEGMVDSSARELMEAFRRAGVSLVILDECHHLVGYWAQVGLALRQTLGSPRILGLTATPPSAANLTNVEISLHRELLDEIDFFLPTPAVVRDGNLAPYQDLVYFTRPREEELAYIRGCTARLADVLAVVEDTSGSTLSAWLRDELDAVPEQRLATLLRQRERFFSNAVSYLRSRQLPVPERFSHIGEAVLDLEQRADLVGRFAARSLLVSDAPADRERFEALARAFRPLGYQLTDKGLRRVQSTVSRVLALSESKMDALVAILEAEVAAGAVDVRALVVCDYEKSSATVDREIAHLVTAESGGAVAAMRVLTSHEVTDALDPILVTGQTVIVDDDLLPAFMDSARAWFEERGLVAEMTPELDGGFYRIGGSGRDWTVRHYVMMVTALFERGLTRCLVGTRGLLGEGWDALGVNTLVDLTTAATEMTVNQLRGRAIRLNPAHPRKLANIWDVVCLAPELEKGLSDYHRLARKHSGYYGLCDDGAIEYGLGHIHPALTETGPEDVALNAHLLNAEMLARCANRAAVYEQWRVGAPYENVQAPSLELKTEGLFGELGTCGGRLYDIQAGEVLKGMCQAVADSLCSVGAFEDEGAELEVTERADGYYRVALSSSSEADVSLLARSVNELFSPIADQRYVIPRVEVMLKPVWLSSLLPRVVGRYVCLKRQTVAVYHPLPEALGGSKQHAELFSDLWNEHVSPGRAVFTKRGQGEEVVVKARQKSESVMEARCKLKSVWR